MNVFTTNNHKKKWNNSIDRAIGEIAGDDRVVVPYFNKQTQDRDPANNGIENPLNYGDRFDTPEIIGTNNRGSFNNLFKTTTTAPSYSEDSSSDSLTLGRVETREMPQRDVERDARLKKIATMRAIVQGIVTLRDIFSKGTYAIGEIGGNEQFMNQLAMADADYSNQMSEWFKENAANQRFNVDADNDERMANYRALQDKLDRDWKTGENALDRDIDGKRIAAMNKRSAADGKKADNERWQYENERKKEAIRNLQNLINSNQKQYEEMSLEQKESPQGKAKWNEIESDKAVLRNMNMQQAGWENYDVPEEQRPTKSTAPRNSNTVENWLNDNMPGWRDKNVNLGGYSYTIQELMDDGISPEKILELVQQQ